MNQFFTTRIATSVLLIMVVTSSCTVIGTLHPIYNNPNEFIIKKELVGKWIDPKDADGYFIVDTFSAPTEKGYEITFISNEPDGEINDTLQFIGHLAQSNGLFFMECWYYVDGKIADLAIPRRFLAKISFPGKDKIELSFPDADRLIKMIDEKKLQLNYTIQTKDFAVENKSFLITDKTVALQKALIEIKKYPELFKDKITLTRSE